MPWKIWAFPCEDCGKWTVRKRKSVDPRICFECGMDRRRQGYSTARRRAKLAREAEGPPTGCGQ